MPQKPSSRDFEAYPRERSASLTRRERKPSQRNLQQSQGVGYKGLDSFRKEILKKIFNDIKG